MSPLRPVGPDPTDGAPGAPALPAVPDLLTAVLHRRCAAQRAAVALATRTDDGWRTSTYECLDVRSAHLAAQLRADGVRRGDRVALLAEPGDGWVLSLLAALRAGAVVVPLDRSLTMPELHAVLSVASASCLLTSPQQLERADALRELLVRGRTVRAVDPAASVAVVPAPRGQADLPPQDDDVALVVFTSGTTGRPKGVVLTHGNLRSQVQALLHAQDLTSRDVLLSLLPPHHMLELTCGLLLPLAAGARICHSPTLHPQEVAVLLRELRVTRMLVVPLFLRLLRRSIEAEVRHAGPAAERAFALLRQAAQRTPSMRARRLLFAAVHRRLGGRLTTFYCGGAALEDDLAGFFEQLGITVLQGYGLTETSPVVAMNTPRHHRGGSVGRPLPGVDVRIDAGEVVVRGTCTMRGYLDQPELTAEVVDAAGWLHTGDLGHVDEDGFLFITGRAKNLIVLESGKKVQPEEVEGALEGLSLVDEVCVLPLPTVDRRGGHREQVCAVVVPSAAARARHQRPEQLHAAILAELRPRLVALAAHKHPASVLLHDGELPKTPTRKVRRAELSAWLTTQEAC